MILKVARLGHPVIRTRTHPVDPAKITTPEFQALLDDMVETMREYSGVGLAAPQVHLSLQVAVLEVENDLQGGARNQVNFSLLTDNLRKHLAKKGFDPLMGARPMQRLIQDTIRRALADELLFGRLTEGGRLTVDIELKTDDKGVETSEVLLDIQPLPKREGKAKPEPEEISSE